MVGVVRCRLLSSPVVALPLSSHYTSSTLSTRSFHSLKVLNEFGSCSCCWPGHRPEGRRCAVAEVVSVALGEHTIPYGEVSSGLVPFILSVTMAIVEDLLY